LEELGFDILGVFGPAPLEARQIVELSKEKPVFIIDNSHNPVGSPLRETLPDAVYVVFSNFPDSEQAGGLLDVLRSNREALNKPLTVR
jgi:hypothetical protein